ncbi:hypothetical protein GCM10010363_15430 [Streptomyces omiyaensis]|nr:hypothetical protein GCM10010363_15430 [Streptomyces omiyaensis]
MLVRGLVTEQGTALVGGPPTVSVLESAGGYVGHDGHGASLRRRVPIVGGTRRGRPLVGSAET